MNLSEAPIKWYSKSKCDRILELTAERKLGGCSR